MLQRQESPDSVLFPQAKETLLLTQFWFTQNAEDLRDLWLEQVAALRSWPHISLLRIWPGVNYVLQYSCSHPSWIQCGSELSLFSFARFFYSDQTCRHFSSQGVQKCFISNVWLNYFRKHFAWKEKPDCEINFLLVRARFVLNLGLGYSLAMTVRCLCSRERSGWEWVMLSESWPLFYF